MAPRQLLLLLLLELERSIQPRKRAQSESALTAQTKAQPRCDCHSERLPASPPCLATISAAPEIFAIPAEDLREDKKSSQYLPSWDFRLFFWGCSRSRRSCRPPERTPSRCSSCLAPRCWSSTCKKSAAVAVAAKAGRPQCQWPHSIYTHIVVGTRVLGDSRPRTSYSLVPRPARTPSAVGCHCPGPRSPIGHRSRQLGARYNYNAARPLPAPAPARTHDTRRPPHASASAHTAHIPLPPACSTHLLGDGTAGLLYSSVRRFTPRLRRPPPYA
eukprot:scaffold31262_cov128-Isochrysis_galbana.AAC.3